MSGDNDLHVFDRTFGLADPSLTVAKQYINNVGPQVDSGWAGEIALDVEWASAAAPSATIMLAACGSTQTTDGIFLAGQNLVNSNNPPPIISISYGDCEAQNGAASSRR